MGRMDRMGVRAEKESCLTAFMITMILVWVRVFLQGNTASWVFPDEFASSGFCLARGF